jgi:hypothetical protein
MKDSIMLTILSGVTVFVLGQFVLKLVLDPIVALKTVFGELSAFFLREQAKITGATSTNEITDEIHRISSSILANRQAIPFYPFFAACLRLPNEKMLLEGCQSLNSIGYHVNPNIPFSGGDRYEAIIKEMKEISTNLKVRVDFIIL